MPKNIFKRVDNSLNDKAFHELCSKFEEDGFESALADGYLDPEDMVANGLSKEKAQFVFDEMNKFLDAKNKILEALEIDKWDEELGNEAFD